MRTPGIFTAAIVAAAGIATAVEAAPIGGLTPTPGTPVITDEVAALYFDDYTDDFGLFFATNLPQTVQATGLIGRDGTTLPATDFDLFVSGVVEGRLRDARFAPDRIGLIYDVTRDPLDSFGMFALADLRFVPGSFASRKSALAPDSPLVTDSLEATMTVQGVENVPLPSSIVALLGALGLTACLRLRRSASRA